jgi:Uma2 family endonuclease
MLELGLITKADRCELIHGLIVEKPRVNPPHAAAVTRLMNRLFPLVAGAATLRVQLPVTLSDSEPEPDLVIAAGAESDYDHDHPSPKDILLLVEVSDSTLDDDSTTKLALYAGEKVSTYWIVNLVDRMMEVYTAPRGGRNPAYRTRTDYRAGESVPVVVGKKTVGTMAVSDLLV